MREGTDEQKEALIVVYGKEFIEDVIAKKEYARIPPDRFYAYYNKKRSYQRYAFPPAGKALPWLQYKLRLRNLNLNTISNAISFIILVRLGSDKFPATPEQIKQFRELWKQRPRKNAASVFFQPHTTDIKIISPPESAYQILREDIFHQPNEQIAQAFGINLALITGVSRASGIGYSTAAIAMRSTVRRIIIAQMKFERFLYTQYRKIGRALGFNLNEIPKPRHVSTGLENPKDMAIAFLHALDRGAVSMKTFMERGLGVDFYKEIEQKKWESEHGVEELFEMRGSPTQKSKDESKKKAMPMGRPPQMENPTTNPEGDLPTPPEDMSIAEWQELYEMERESIEEMIKEFEENGLSLEE